SSGPLANYRSFFFRQRRKAFALASPNRETDLNLPNRHPSRERNHHEDSSHQRSFLVIPNRRSGRHRNWSLQRRFIGLGLGNGTRAVGKLDTKNAAKS